MDYVGEELESFALARNWKDYVCSALHPYLAGEVAEIGAGLGETTRALRAGSAARRWTCVEPDPAMAAKVAAAAAGGELGAAVDSQCGTLADLAPERRFDTILYIDVLEHIEHDRDELAGAAARLRSGGRIVVLSPAFPFLYSAFDRAIGHYRRYTRPMLRALTPERTVVTAGFYLDGVGLLASLANRLLLRQALPSPAQVVTWDRLMVPLSRLLDPVTRHSFGRSVVMVWTRC